MSSSDCEKLDASIRRICVVGTSGSGKSTMADNLAQALHIPHLELDSVHWLPGWQERDREETRRIVGQFIQAEAWIIDGNYSWLRDILLPRAQALVWLDYRLGVTLWRLWWRTLRRGLSHELLWGTNRERLAEQFYKKDSIFLWALQTYKRHKKQYSKITDNPDYAHLKVYRLGSPRKADTWLAALEQVSIPQPSF